MIMKVFTFLVALLITAILAPAARADDQAVAQAGARYSACLARIQNNPVFAPLAATGFMRPPASIAPADLSDGNFATQAQISLVEKFQQTATICQIRFWTELVNIDAGLADRVSQYRQQTDVNDLFLVDGKESWGQYQANRAKIEAPLDQIATTTPTATQTATQTETVADLATDTPQ